MLRWLVALAISALTLADGVLHLRLDYLLFGGTLWVAAAELVARLGAVQALTAAAARYGRFLGVPVVLG